jgi:hypothetical protein
MSTHRDRPLVSVIILNWNGRDYLRKCVDSVLQSNYPKDKLEVLVVDNHSTDRSIELVKKMPGIRTIENVENLGFCEGNNVAIRQSRGELIILLNNDTYVDKQWIDEIVKVAEDPEVGVIGTKILVAKTSVIESVGFYVQDLFQIKSIGFGEEDACQYETVKEVDYVSGVSLAIKRRVIEQIGLLDPYFYSYGEDCDWCYRARKVGYKVVVAPKAVIYHYGATSWNKRPLRKTYLGERNRLYLSLKHFQDVNPISYIYGCFRFELRDIMRVLKKATITQRHRGLNGKRLLKICIREFVVRRLAQTYVMIIFPRLRRLTLEKDRELFRSGIISKSRLED